MEKERILWLDSVKGISCWAVFFGHFVFCYGFLPFIHRWVSEDKVTSFTCNGNAAMDVFIIISAFIEASVFLNIEEKFRSKAGTGIVKRYFRFAIPVFMIELVVFLLQKSGLWTDRFPAIPVRDIPFSEILYDSFYLTLFKGSSNVYPVFWMINVMFIGYMLVLLLCAILSVVNRVTGYILLSVLLIFTMVQLNMFFLVFFGVFLYLLYRDIYDKGVEKKTGSLRIVRYVAGALFIILSIYMAGRDNQLAELMTVKGLPEFTRMAYFICWIAAAFLMAGLVLCTPAVKLLSNRKLAAMGKICFPMFLLHPLCLVTFGEYAYRFFDARAGEFNHGTKAAFFASFVSMVILSVLYAKFMEPLINKLTNKIIGVVARK